MYKCKTISYYKSLLAITSASLSSSTEITICLVCVIRPSSILGGFRLVLLGPSERHKVSMLLVDLVPLLWGAGRECPESRISVPARRLGLGRRATKSFWLTGLIGIPQAAVLLSLRKGA
jgi:hypothetical protein